MNTAQSGSQILFIALFITGGLAGVLLWLLPTLGRSGRAVSGTLKIKKHQYSFEVGDSLLRAGSAHTFSGMDIHLRRQLPHIFLDGRANSYATRSQYILEDDEKVIPGGEFSELFQAYVSGRHKQLAFSILTPDVLRALQKSTFTYDLEVMGDHVRLIVAGMHGISRNEALKNDLATTATIIMKEIDHYLHTIDATVGHVTGKHTSR